MKFLPRLIEAAGKVVMKPFYPVKFIGPRKFEKKKTIFVGNHISAWDPVVFLVWSKTHVSFVYKNELRKSRFLRWFFDGVDLIPVKRGEVDITATKTILRLLNDDRPIGLFPEGTRNVNVDCLQEFKTGAALFAIKTKSPIRPFYVWDKAKTFRKNYYIVGDEFTLEQFYDKPITKEMLAEATEIIKEKVDELRVRLNAILAEKGVKRRKRTKKELAKIEEHNRLLAEAQSGSQADGAQS